MSTSKREFWRSRWWMPGVSVFLGLLILAAFWVGGNPGGGFFGLGLMVVIGALFLFGGRSETLRGLGGPGRDERWARIDVHATAVTGMVTILVIIGAWLVEIARGNDGNPYGLLGAVSGVVYIVSVAVLRWRS
jgi:hypothetical protein